MKQDVIVIGGGIIGLATAEGLLRKGAQVTLIERNQIGQEASWAGGGILSPLYPWHESSEINQLTQYSASLFPDWTTALQRSTGINCGYETSGMLVLPPFNKQQAQQWCEKQKIAIRQYVPTGLNQFKKTNIHSIFLPEIAQVRSPHLLQALKKKIKISGGHIIEYCAAHNFATKKNCVQSLSTSDEMLIADQYIVTAGAWSTGLLERYALNLSIRPIRGQMLLFHFDTPPVNKIILQHGRYIIPRTDGYLLIGSTLEDVGFDNSTTQSAYNELLDWAKKLLPQLHGRSVVKQWAGLRPESSLGIPVIARHPTLKNLYVNSGHFRYGVTMAPASAEILLNIITDSPQPFDTTPYQEMWRSN